MSAMQGYVVGFLICPETDSVVLVRKARPAWQAGTLNGVGGHVEPLETPRQAMVREFREETGLTVAAWDLMLTMTFPGASITFYRAHADADTLSRVRTTTDEEVGVWPIAPLLVKDSGVIPNLRWLLPLAAYTADRYAPVTLRATVAEVLT